MTSTQSPTLTSSMDPDRHIDVRAMLLAHATATLPTATTIGPAASGTATDATVATLAPQRRAPLHPTPRPARPGRRVGLALASAAAVATITAVMISADPTAPASYASWQAVPATAPDAPVSQEDAAAWASQCNDLVGEGLAFAHTPTAAAGAANGAAGREVLVDRRGGFTFCVDASLDPTRTEHPLIAVSGLRADSGLIDGLSGQGWSTVSNSDDLVRTPAAEEVLVLGGDLQTPASIPGEDAEIAEAGRIYQLFGFAGADVDGVDIVLSNGTSITATVRHGLWGAWWPASEGEPGASRLTIHTSTGDQTIASSEAALELPA